MVCRLFYHVAKITEVPQQHWILYIVAQRDAFLVDVQTSAVTDGCCTTLVAKCSICRPT